MSDSVALVNPEKKKAATTKKEVPSKPENEVPMGYAPVKLSTRGKLSSSMTLHFRDYTLEETSELSSIREENYLERLVTILNRMVHENFDCGQLHIEEMKEVLLTIHANFWSPVLRDMAYKIDPDGEEKKENYARADVEIAKIQIDELPEEFKEPITIQSNSGMKMKFRLPRVSDVFVTNKYLDEKYGVQEQKFAKAKLFVESQRGTTFDVEKFSNPQMLLEYMDFLEKKNSEYNIVNRLLRLIEFDGQKLSSLDEKLSHRNDIDMTVWTDLNWVMEKYRFGVNPEVKFTDPNGNSIARRFQFRSLDFIPDMAVQTNSRNAISFGD